MRKIEKIFETGGTIGTAEKMMIRTSLKSIPEIKDFIGTVATVDAFVVVHTEDTKNDPYNSGIIFGHTEDGEIIRYRTSSESFIQTMEEIIEIWETDGEGIELKIRPTEVASQSRKDATYYIPEWAV